MAWDALANYTPDQLLALRQKIGAGVNATDPNANGGYSTYTDPTTGQVYSRSFTTSQGGGGEGGQDVTSQNGYTSTDGKPWYQGQQAYSYDMNGNKTGQWDVSNPNKGAFTVGGKLALGMIAGMAGGAALGGMSGGGAAASGSGGGSMAGDAFMPGALGADGTGAVGAVGGTAGGAAYAPGALGSGTFDTGLGSIADAGITSGGGVGGSVGGTAGGLGGASGVGAAGTAAGGSGATGGGGYLLGSSGGMTAPAGLGAAMPAAGGGNALTAALGSGQLSSLAGPAASLAGGIYGAGAARDAAKVQQQSAQDAIAAEQGMFNKVVDLNEPFRQGGVQGMNALTTALGITPGTNSGWAMRDFTPSDLTTDPSYQWRLDQGNQAVARGAAASGGLGSGRYLKDLTNYSQGAASQEFGAASNRYQANRAAKLAPLQSLAGVGQSAAGTVGSAAQNFGNNQANLITGAGNAGAAGIVGGANAITNGIGQGISSYQTGNLMSRLLQPNGGSSYGGYGGYGGSAYSYP